jgi:dephospho-CoA kinase
VLDRANIPVIGIVGGIGSGKSALARWAADRHDDWVVIDGDAVGHEILALPAVRKQVRERFGALVFDALGHVDRKALGRAVFGPQEDNKSALADLERIVHPRIREAFEHRIADAAAAGRSAVLLDAAVLFEAGWNDLCNAVVFVDVPIEERRRRLQANRNWDETELSRREASQLSLETKRSRANFVIDNGYAIDAAGRQLEQFVRRFDKPA